MSEANVLENLSVARTPRADWLRATWTDGGQETWREVSRQFISIAAAKHEGWEPECDVPEPVREAFIAKAREIGWRK